MNSADAIGEIIDTLEHRFGETFVDAAGVWRASCQCGWRSLGYGYPGKAFQAWQKYHEAPVARRSKARPS